MAGGGRDASQSDFGGSSSGNNNNGGGGDGNTNRERGIQQSYETAQKPTAAPQNDGRDPTVQYQDTPQLTIAQKETLEKQREQATKAISPMTDPKNKLIAAGLSTLFPGAGTLYGLYKTNTAMGFNQNIANAFDNFFSGKDRTTTYPDFTPDNTRGDGDFRSQVNQLAPLAPYVASGQEALPSVASRYIPSFQDAFQTARTKVNQQLGTPSNFGLLAVSESPFYDFLQIRGLNRRIL